MRTETIKIYTIEDHPNPESCFEWIRNNWHDLAQHYVDDMIESLKALRDTIGGDLDYSLSVVPDRGEFCIFKNYDAAKLEELYKSKDSCPLTGMCYDIDIIEAIKDNSLESAVLSILHKEGEYAFSDEGLRDTCEANGYEFLEDGTFK